MGYALKTIFLDLRGQVTWKKYVTLCDPKMHSHTIFGIPTSNNIGYENNFSRPEARCQGQVTWKLYVTLCDPKMHSHTIFGNPTSKNIADYMLRTQFFQY